MIPEPWEFALLALAAFRLFWLLGEDDISESFRRWLTANGRREKIDLFLACPWCAGFWIGWFVWLSWLALDEWAVFYAVPLAISALVGAVTVALHALIDA